jgi:DNA-binding PadR family transcriptional regulator
MRITVPVARVLSVFLSDVEEDRYGLDLMRLTGLPSGTLYPLLRRLQEAGWVQAQWEQIDPAAEGRPARRYYRLTAEGTAQARTALAELHAQTSAAPPASPAKGKARPAW